MLHEHDHLPDGEYEVVATGTFEVYAAGEQPLAYLSRQWVHPGDRCLLYVMQYGTGYTHTVVRKADSFWTTSVLGSRSVRVLSPLELLAESA